MLAKCIIIIVAIGLTACGLLAMRQARLQAVHELAQAQLRIARIDEQLLTLHAQIADEITPSSLQQRRARLLEARLEELDASTPDTDAERTEQPELNPEHAGATP